jgi:hypothetical protein
MNLSPLNLPEALADVRPMPETLFPAIEARLQRTNRGARLFYALAALIVLCVGALTVTGIALRRPPIAVTAAATMDIDQDVVEELQVLHDFANGNDIDAELAEYAMNDE